MSGNRREEREEELRWENWEPLRIRTINFEDDLGTAMFCWGMDLYHMWMEEWGYEFQSEGELAFAEAEWRSYVAPKLDERFYEDYFRKVFEKRKTWLQYQKDHEKDHPIVAKYLAEHGHELPPCFKPGQVSNEILYSYVYLRAIGLEEGDAAKDTMVIANQKKLEDLKEEIAIETILNGRVPDKDERQAIQKQLQDTITQYKARPEWEKKEKGQIKEAVASSKKTFEEDTPVINNYDIKFELSDYGNH
ncbi:hypothetical protein BJ508DRAFT_324779 [Ascobolus immersus RN42]|uniref:Uncharacterized protein n=1 Tax=Ascobolus immersus RN42 TaxID=1160509 RepID=A0A3N4IGC8_ASCIM|nr:hypothetical protein BJ508DRAFT_324779 [Ascobolus immersus RN42]